MVPYAGRVVCIVYNKQDKYVIRQQQQKIRNLEAELARIKNSSRTVVVNQSYFSSLHEHYVSFWRKGNLIKIKVNVNPNYKANDIYYLDSFGWELVYRYVQIALFPLDFRYFYIIDTEKE